MRLSAEEVDILVAEIKKHDEAAEIWLYGSRADDHARGGDIDLCVVSDKIRLSEKLDILVEVKMLLGDQRIDLKIITPKKLESDPFFASVRGSAVKLKKR